MANLEDVLPSFRIGAKIRREDWGKGCYIQWHQRNIVTQNENDYKFTNEDIISDKWIVYIDISIDFKVGKSYRTKDGRKAFVSVVDNKYVYGIIEDDRVTTTWNKKGISTSEDDGSDIISEWND